MHMHMSSAEDVYRWCIYSTGATANLWSVCDCGQGRPGNGFVPPTASDHEL